MSNTVITSSIYFGFVQLRKLRRKYAREKHELDAFFLAYFLLIFLTYASEAHMAINNCGRKENSALKFTAISNTVLFSVSYKYRTCR